MEQEVPEEPRNSEIQRLVMDYLDGQIDSSRDFKDKTGISHAMFGRYKEMKSMMSVAKLEHIVSKYDSLRTLIVEHLGGKPERNITNEGIAASQLKIAIAEFAKELERLVRDKTKLEIENQDLKKQVETLIQLSTKKAGVTG